MIGLMRPRGMNDSIGQYVDRSYMHDYTSEPFDLRAVRATNEFLRLFTTNCMCHKILIGDINKDGYKIGCFEPYDRPDCLVYSFGSDGNFDYELGVFNEFGCEIHTVDKEKFPSVHNLEFTQAEIGTCSNCRSVRHILEGNGHWNRTISALKIDIEGSEWEMLDEVFTNNVNQVQMEIHNPTYEKMRELDRFSDRFCLVDTNINIAGRQNLELVFVNKNLMKEMNV
ncbi:methyltransferase domain-containing protein [Gongronella butleri]|nr:methyltransferase domain-containing protein [Gongronella butleri]